MSEELKEWYNTVPYEEIKNIIRDRISLLRDCLSNRTALVDHLKEVQKK